jgi:hypothetical protein
MTDEQILALVHRLRRKSRILWGAIVAIMAALAEEDTTPT